MDERLRFVARLLEGEKMAALCREFGISRVTGYKIFNRYRECGLDALNDRSRRPYRHANRLPFQVERTILGDQARAHLLGRTEDPRQADPSIADDQGAGDQHDPRRARSARSGQASQTPTLQGPGHRAQRCACTQRTVVRRLQRRVHARQPPILLSADDHRLPLALSARLRGAVVNPLAVRLHGVRASVQGLRPARCDPHRQRRALRLRPRRSSGSPRSRSGGCDSASTSSASSPATRSKTAATNACT